MLQCEICAETLVETLLGEERAEPNQKENNESGNQATDHACCIHPVSRPPIVLLLATPYVCRFLLELRHIIARPLCLPETAAISTLHHHSQSPINYLHNSSALCA
jgi:hypothetical protein